MRWLVTLWTLLWVAVTTPCAMAGDLGGAGHGLPGSAPTGQMAGHAVPGGDHDPAGALLCFQDCNQLAIGNGPQADPAAAPLEGLAEPLAETLLPLSFAFRAPAAPNGGPAYPKAATYLLNQSLLI
ncbi:MAG: hypothetical protein ABEK42_11560 [Thiohalorhabdaceae bacterium]